MQTNCPNPDAHDGSCCDGYEGQIAVLQQVVKDKTDEIERLRKELEAVNNEFGSQTADWPEAWTRVAKLKQIMGERWQRIVQLKAGLEAIADGEGDAQEIARQTLLGL